jgi:hypothetical protein
VGAVLLAAVETWAAERGFEIMRIRSNVIREDAHGFYEAHGYTNTKRQIVFAKDLIRQDSAPGAAGQHQGGPTMDNATGEIR